MRILGIETSCDDTGIALLKAEGERALRFQILSNVVASQIKVHQKYGGVYPTLAKREHEKNLPIVLKQALKEISEIDAIAVTYGPGLSPCLWTGLNFAKELAKKWGVPLVPVDHIEAHLLIGLFRETRNVKRETQKKKGFMFHASSFKNIFPALALIVSGGHTQLVLVKGIGKYRIIGETRDDAAGECFDKTARILGLEYPGGPAIAREAAQWKSKFRNPNFETNSKLKIQNSFKIKNLKFEISLPRPMMHSKDYDFSFSGLKTAVLYEYQARPKKERESKAYIQEMATEIQQAIVDVLCHKTLKAAKEFGAKSIILGGGVAANSELRSVLTNKAGTIKINTWIPPPNLATDNGAMVALAGYFTYRADSYEKNPDKIAAQPNLRIA